MLYLGLLVRKNDIFVRASAADALKALSSKSAEAKKAIVSADGVRILIGATVAPSKEYIKTKSIDGLVNTCYKNCSKKA
ncbi:hypothetical protein K1719_044492 [Acacia pycnantha]|nr:hypothetical protein K1719_044492 [Acacia pycnantha]